MHTIADKLLDQSILGLFVLILLYFARDTLLSVKEKLKQSQTDQKSEVDAYRMMITEKTTENKDLQNEFRAHLITTQAQLIDVLAENSRAYVEFANSLLMLAKSNELSSQIIQQYMIQNIDKTAP